METIDVELSDFTLRRRSLQVSHAGTALGRGLEPGEQVLLHDPVHGYFSGHVAELDFEPADTVYRVSLGIRHTHEAALRRRNGASAGAPGRLTKQDLLDLLAQLRASSPAIPTAGRHRRADTAL